MKLLIAEQDRDFPAVFSALLHLYGYETEAVFDGTQVLTRLATENYDAAVLDDTLPRISHGELIAAFRKKSVPVIVITSKPFGTSLLTGKTPANDYLSLPFLPDELIKLIEKIEKYKNTAKSLVYSDAEIVPSEFMLCGSQPVTAGEIELFSELIEKKTVNGKRSGIYVSSLNMKLRRLNKKTHIRYMINEGYRLVNKYE